MKKRVIMVVIILLLAIGFASISTVLVINGNAKVGENTSDFDIIFTKASLDGTDVYNTVIDDTKKIINFTTSDLKTLKQTAVLTYEVTNNSSNYDAEVEVNCKVKNNTTAKYTSIENVLEGNATVIKAKETLNGTLTVTLNKTSTEELTEEYTCEVTANAVEKTSLSYNGPYEWVFDYTGSEQTFTVPVSGTYKLETWGAQGGSINSYIGGYGAYSTGNIDLEINDKIYINIGGEGTKYQYDTSATTSDGIVKATGGYNGGGNGMNVWSEQTGTTSIQYNTSGGGATHIATQNGLLLSFKNQINNLLIVSSGGGGAQYFNRSYDNKYSYCNGASGGGIEGTIVYANSSFAKPYITTVSVATQTTAGILNYGQRTFSADFGEGASGYTGGGSGLYGGPGGFAISGGGSSYIGNPLLTNKAMYCYNCEESTEENTKTISTTCANEEPTENCAKIGNGYARITFIK